MKDTVGESKYLPPASREWTNNVYNYNLNNVKNYPVHNLNINTLIKGYFSMYFNYKEFKGKRFRNKGISLNRIFVSKAEVKHTNSKAIITIYVYNREKLILLKKIKLLKLILTKFILIQTKLISRLGVKDNTKLIDHLLNKYKMKTRFSRRIENYSKKLITREISITLALLRKCMLKLHLNKSKFEEKFLFKLSNYISKYYGKKVEFNIINLKHISNNVDIFTEIFMLKVKSSKRVPLMVMRQLLNKIKIKQVKNRLLERGRVQNVVNFDLVENKFKNKTLSNILYLHQSNAFGASANPSVSGVSSGLGTTDGINKVLNDFYLNSEESGGRTLSASSQIMLNDQSKDFNRNNALESNSAAQNKISDFISVSGKDMDISMATDSLTIRRIILANIKYKETGGVKLEMKGRLTKRYRADRAIYKFKWKGGLKNIDSAFKGLRTVVYRGYMDANVEKSIFVSKRRIGSFAVKGWLSRK